MDAGRLLLVPFFLSPLILQELSQSGISMVRKNQLKEKYDKMASEVAAIAKAKTAADQKLVSCIVSS